MRALRSRFLNGSLKKRASISASRRRPKAPPVGGIIMAWTYCGKCGEGLPYPTPPQIVNESYNCESCGANNDPLITVGELVLELFDEVAELKAVVQLLDERCR